MDEDVTADESIDLRLSYYSKGDSIHQDLKISSSPSDYQETVYICSYNQEAQYGGLSCCDPEIDNMLCCGNSSSRHDLNNDQSQNCNTLWNFAVSSSSAENMTDAEKQKKSEITGNNVPCYNCESEQYDITVKSGTVMGYDNIGASSSSLECGFNNSSNICDSTYTVGYNYGMGWQTTNAQQATCEDIGQTNNVLANLCSHLDGLELPIDCDGKSRIGCNCEEFNSLSEVYKASHASATLQIRSKRGSPPRLVTLEGYYTPDGVDNSIPSGNITLRNGSSGVLINNASIKYTCSPSGGVGVERVSFEKISFTKRSSVKQSFQTNVAMILDGTGAHAIQSSLYECRSSTTDDLRCQTHLASLRSIAEKCSVKTILTFVDGTSTNNPYQSDEWNTIYKGLKEIESKLTTALDSCSLSNRYLYNQQLQIFKKYKQLFGPNHNHFSNENFGFRYLNNNSSNDVLGFSDVGLSSRSSTGSYGADITQRDATINYFYKLKNTYETYEQKYLSSIRGSTKQDAQTAFCQGAYIEPDASQTMIGQVRVPFCSGPDQFNTLIYDGMVNIIHLDNDIVSALAYLLNAIQTAGGCDALKDDYTYEITFHHDFDMFKKDLPGGHCGLISFGGGSASGDSDDSDDGDDGDDSDNDCIESSINVSSIMVLTQCNS